VTLVDSCGRSRWRATAAASVGLASDLPSRARMQVVTVGHRLAPEHPYPAAQHHAMAAYRALLDRGQSVPQISRPRHYS